MKRAGLGGQRTSLSVVAILLVLQDVKHRCSASCAQEQASMHSKCTCDANTLFQELQTET